MEYNIELVTEEVMEKIGVFDLDRFRKSLEFIKSKLSEEDYETLKSEYNFTLHTFTVTDLDLGE